MKPNLASFLQNAPSSYIFISINDITIHSVSQAILDILETSHSPKHSTYPNVLTPINSK